MDDAKKVAHVSHLMERFSRESEALRKSNLRAVDALQRTTGAVPGLLQEAARQTLSDLTTDTTRAVQQGLNRPLDDFSRQVIENIHRIDGATRVLAHSQQQIAMVIGKLKWLVAGVLSTILLVMLVGGGLLWHYRNVIADNQIQADLMRAYNQADVTLCGGQLCARVDRADKRYGDYLLVKPR
jgi:hypothetical protein